MRRLLILFVILTACGGSAVADGPPEIDFGRDICLECGMSIDDARFASAYRLADGTERLFDDLGGLILYGRETGELDQAEVWVSDFETQQLIRGESAFFVPTRGVSSPMGHGLLAFGDEERARAFAHDLEGEVLVWEEVAALPVTDGLVGDHHGDEHGHSHDDH